MRPQHRGPPIQLCPALLVRMSLWPHGRGFFYAKGGCLALPSGGSYAAERKTPMDEATPYACPTCGAEYKVVRVEAKTMVPEGV